MKTESHLNTLKQKHSNLDAVLSEINKSPSIDPLDIYSIKRQKLLLKDKITLLES